MNLVFIFDFMGYCGKCFFRDGVWRDFEFKFFKIKMKKFSGRFEIFILVFNDFMKILCGLSWYNVIVLEYFSDLLLYYYFWGCLLL